MDNDSDIFFNKNPLCYTGDTTEASNVLENCENFACKDVDMLLNKSENNFNTYFYNIDGNKSNFDVFAAEIKKIQGEISVIGIAETNVNSDQKDLYRLDNYESFYSDKLDDKKSGTGIALYVHKKFNATLNIVASTTMPHLESLFITLMHEQLTMNIGIVYRPPNSSFLEFMTQLQVITKSLPKTITYLMGDFNLDLHKIQTNSNAATFEQFFISEGLYPVISLATHKNYIGKSCIDNIFTNRIETITNSGIIENCGSAHSPIFSTSKLDYNVKPGQKEKIVQYYDYCNKNTNNFVHKLEENIDILIGSDPSSPPDFATFFLKYQEYLDETCKLSTPKTTVRNSINNPWITDSIISSIDEKQKLHKKWKLSCNKKCPDGDRSLYKTFSDYRRVLKHIIASEKKKYHNKKFQNASGDPKKTWEIINQLRGRHKKETKPSFKIDNKRITERRVIANEFNKYFVSIASKLNDEVQINSGSYMQFMPGSQTHSIFLTECTNEEVNNIT